MKAILLGCVAALSLAFAASQILPLFATPANVAYATEGVRLDEGH